MLELKETDTGEILKLSNLVCRAFIDGIRNVLPVVYTVEVSLTLTFKNHFPRDVEANLTVPLHANAVVCGYAVEIDGQLVEACIVAKEVATQICMT